MIEPRDVEAIERATIAALSPEAVLEIGGWLVALGAGAARRSKSAVPLSHDLAADAASLDAIAVAYAERGLTPGFRVADAPGLQGVRDALAARGYRPEQPTLVKVGATAGMRAICGGAPAEVTDTPDESWKAVFLGPGFDPADGASRIELLTRSGENRFGAVREAGAALAVGVGSFGDGWASVHGMRTAAERRGQGLAARVLAGLAATAEARGLTRVFLQVEEPNAPARALYRRAEFRPAWRYFYWAKEGARAD
ncbi:GNAT family N-acetyltransferase [Phenylobacterium sp.]|uniref:GNAT family N-acetyltransferase n=1 Tax=Phenylobacterium sp. TaxID=1871053 RepID=UPI002E2F0A51|nr:GNAT family N-acetyltransferase [Phenylobacterium sp.]HEX2560470.1 GNAT family N-acetyltransferase [Phenylobacterium sp.]